MRAIGLPRTGTARSWVKEPFENPGVLIFEWVWCTSSGEDFCRMTAGERKVWGTGSLEIAAARAVVSTWRAVVVAAVAVRGLGLPFLGERGGENEEGTSVD